MTWWVLLVCMSNMCMSQLFLVMQHLLAPVLGPSHYLSTNFQESSKQSFQCGGQQYYLFSPHLSGQFNCTCFAKAYNGWSKAITGVYQGFKCTYVYFKYQHSNIRLLWVSKLASSEWFSNLSWCCSTTYNYITISENSDIFLKIRSVAMYV